MPFNERGDWVSLNPYEAYIDRVVTSKEQPGSGGYLWNEEERHRMHNAATFWLLENQGIEATRGNFDVMREKIGREAEEFYDISERNGFIKQVLLPEQVGHNRFASLQSGVTGVYRSIGD